MNETPEIVKIEPEDARALAKLLPEGWMMARVAKFLDGSMRIAYVDESGRHKSVLVGAAAAKAAFGGKEDE